MASCFRLLKVYAAIKERGYENGKQKKSGMDHLYPGMDPGGSRVCVCTGSSGHCCCPCEINHAF